MNLHIVWIGPLASERKLLMHHDALSPAGVRWNGAFASALRSTGANIANIYQLARRSWPHGPLWVPGRTGEELGGILSTWVPYLNIRGPRERMQALGYRTVLDGMHRKDPTRRCLVIYNPLPHQVNTAMRTQRRYGWPWVCIYADWYPSNISAEECERRGASGHIFLSWHDYKAASCINKIHFDGGITSMRRSIGDPLCRSKTVVYTGKLNTLGGVNLLIKAFRQVRHPEAKLVITGRGWTKDLEELRGNDYRISYVGLVSSEKLDTICSNAEIFVNPRPSNMPENERNFPSKLLEYLSWGRPIISTLTKGLHPSYSNLMECLHDETHQALAAKIDSILNWDEERYRCRCDEITLWASTKKLWSVQSAQFIEWLVTVGAKQSDAYSAR